MKKQFLLLMALMAFGLTSAQHKMSVSKIADNLTDKNKKETRKSEKKSSKEELKKTNPQKPSKTEKETKPARKFKKYYINASGQKTYVD